MTDISGSWTREMPASETTVRYLVTHNGSNYQFWAFMSAAGG